MRFWTVILIALVVCSAFLGMAQAETLTGRVIWVYDGDSFLLSGPEGKQEVRVFGIDCPEKGQPFARQALKFSIKTIKNKEIKLEVLDKDRYGRFVGIVNLPDGRNLAHLLLKAGLAWHYRKYSDDPIMAGLEEKARRAGVGLWKDDESVPPWVYKRNKK